MMISESVFEILNNFVDLLKVYSRERGLQFCKNLFPFPSFIARLGKTEPSFEQPSGWGLK